MTEKPGATRRIPRAVIVLAILLTVCFWIRVLPGGRPARNYLDLPLTNLAFALLSTGSVVLAFISLRKQLHRRASLLFYVPAILVLLFNVLVALAWK